MTNQITIARNDEDMQALKKAAAKAGKSEASFIEETIAKTAKANFAADTIARIRNEFVESFAKNFWLLVFFALAFVLLTPWYYISEGYLIRAIGGVPRSEYNIQKGEIAKGIIHKYYSKHFRIPPQAVKPNETNAFDIDIREFKLKKPPIAIMQSITGAYYAESIFSFESIYCDNIRMRYNYTGYEQVSDFNFDMNLIIVPSEEGLDIDDEGKNLDAETSSRRCEGRVR